MKKHFIVLSAVLFALVACNKETPIVEDGPIDASKLVFNVTVNHPGDTKAVKSNWVAGDKIYLFFENNTTAYVTLTSDDGSNRNWTPAISGELDLEHEGEHVTAVYLPFNTDTPTYDGGWKFETKYAYYLKAEGVEYTVTTDPSTDINTLDVKLSMVAPAGFVQFFLPDVSPVANKYVLIEEHIIPAGCGKITPGGSVAQVTRLRSSKMAVSKGTGDGNASHYNIQDVLTTSGYPMEAMTVSGEGYYFYGTLSADVNNPTFYLVQQNPDYLFAIGTQTKTYTGKTLSAGAAIKFGAFGAQERWVDLNLPNGVKWATGNVSNTGMVGPTQIGQFYAWGETTGYSPSEGKFPVIFNWDRYAFFYEPGPTYDIYGDTGNKKNDVYLNKYTKGHTTVNREGDQEGDGLITLELADDAAYKKVGSHWRIGTIDEWRELVANCSSVTQFGANCPGGPDRWINDGEIMGWLLQRNGLYYFLPATGNGTSFTDKSYTDTEYCFYWTSRTGTNGNYLLANYFIWSASNTNRLLTVNSAAYRRSTKAIRPVYIP